MLLYGVTRACEQATGNGLEGRPLETIAADGLGAIVSSDPSGVAAPSESLLWEYEQVLERLMACHVVLPARFGSVLADRTAVHDMLRRRSAELGRSLGRVEGAVEFGVTTGWSEVAPTPESTTGTSYLLGRLTMHRRASEVARRLGPLAMLSRSSRQRVLPRPSLPVTASYLVEKERSEEFVETVAQLDGLLDGVHVICTGPWPPYSFVAGVDG